MNRIIGIKYLGKSFGLPKELDNATLYLGDTMFPGYISSKGDLWDANDNYVGFLTPIEHVIIIDSDGNEVGPMTYLEL